MNPTISANAMATLWCTYSAEAGVKSIRNQRFGPVAAVMHLLSVLQWCLEGEGRSGKKGFSCRKWNDGQQSGRRPDKKNVFPEKKNRPL